MDAIAGVSVSSASNCYSSFSVSTTRIEIREIGITHREMDASIQSTLYRYKSRNPCHGKDSKECRKSTKRTVLISSDGAGGEDPAV
jgi:hypothetical protein